MQIQKFLCEKFSVIIVTVFLKNHAMTIKRPRTPFECSPSIIHRISCCRGLSFWIIQVKAFFISLYKKKTMVVVVTII